MSAELLQAVVRRDYDLLIKKHPDSRISSTELRSVINDYGRRLVLPPCDAYQNLDAVWVKNARAPTWSVRTPLWTEEEGKSDLTLELTVTLGPGSSSVEIDDLRVL